MVASSSKQEQALRTREALTRALRAAREKGIAVREGEPEPEAGSFVWGGALISLLQSPKGLQLLLEVVEDEVVAQRLIDISAALRKNSGAPEARHNLLRRRITERIPSSYRMVGGIYQRVRRITAGGILLTEIELLIIDSAALDEE